MDFTEQEEEERCVDIAVSDEGGGRRWSWGWLEVACEVVEGGEEVAGDEEDLVGEGERVEVVEGEEEERRRGEDGGEAAEVAVAK